MKGRRHLKKKLKEGEILSLIKGIKKDKKRQFIKN